MRTTYYQRLPDVLPVIADLIPDYVEGMTAISRIHVLPPFRRLGYGSTVLRRIIRDADSEGVTLCLEINPYGEMTYDQLAKWYESYGFHLSQSYSESKLYVRSPNIR